MREIAGGGIFLASTVQKRKGGERSVYLIVVILLLFLRRRIFLTAAGGQMDGRENKEDVFTLLSRIFVCWFSLGWLGEGGCRQGCCDEDEKWLFDCRHQNCRFFLLFLAEAGK